MTRFATMAAMLAALAAGCGGSSGPPNGPAGVDRNQPVSAVSDTDKAALCDWYSAMVGGYGTSPSCADYLISAPPDQSICVSAFPSCDATVGQLADCIVAAIAAQNTCTDQSLMSVQMRADCLAASGCFT